MTDRRTRPARRRGAAAVAVGAALLAAACSSTPSTDAGGSTSTTRPSTAGSTPGSTPGSAPGTTEPGGPAPIDEAALQAAFEAEAGALFTPGSVMVLETPSGTYTFTYGTADWEGTRPVSPDDHIRIGSITKTWTASVILQQVQEGKLALDDPVSDYRPDVPNGPNITVEQLLTMRSGLENYTQLPAFNAIQDAEPQKAWTPDELLAFAFAEPPFAAPGEAFHYANTNTVLLGLIAEELDGKPLAEIIQDRILTPLGMDESTFPAITDSSIADPHADGYMFGTNVSTIDGAELPPDELAAAEAGTLQPNNYTNFNPSWGWSAGAGISTIGDLVTYVKALTGDDAALLDEDLTAGRLDSIIASNPDVPEVGYGWGLARFGTMYGHTGELPGYNTFMANDPVNHITLVVWANLAPDPGPKGLPPATTIARNLIPIIYGAGASEDDVTEEDPGATP
jgi:D-alanyl-D-alanine carboxypeptidase